MVTAISYLRLVRLPILVLIVLIQYCMRYFIIDPMLKINGFELVVSDKYFLYSVIGTVLIAAGGFAINDYFDVKIDRINKLKRVIVDRYIPRRMAMMLHIILTSIGFALVLYVAWRLGIWKISAIYLFAIFTLWFYSTTLQHQFLAGNVAIALMAAFVPLMVGLFEIPLQNAAHPDVIKELGYSIFNVPAYWIMGISAALFVLTLAREITKDVIDLRGDKISGARTIPIRLGTKPTKTLLISVYALFGALLSYAYLLVLEVHSGMTTVFYVTALLLILQIILIFRARTKKHFLHSANLNNIITVLLIASTFLIKISIENHFS